MSLPDPLAGHLLLVSERDQWAGAKVASRDAALLVVRREEARDIALAFGPHGGVAHLLAAESDERDGHGAPLWLSADARWRPDAATLAGLNVVAGFGWEWFALEDAQRLRPPEPASGEVAVAPIDRDRHDAAIREVLRISNPRSSADPAASNEVEWWGAWEGDSLLGVIGAAAEQGRCETGPAGYSWHLHGLGVVPAARGSGLGGRLTAAITAAGFAAGADFVSLGIYSDNDRARAIYQRLGYVRHAAMTAYRPSPG